MLLPNEASIQGVAGQGWSIKTAVRDSLIPGAGKGRFAEETVASGTKVHTKRIVHMSTVDSLLRVSPDVTLTFGKADEIEKYISLAIGEGGYSREEVMETLEHFIWCHDGERACLNNCTWSMNHGHAPGALNIKFYDNGKGEFIGETVDTLSIGDEMTNSYHEFFMPEFFLDYCEENNIKDARTTVMEAIGELKTA